MRGLWMIALLPMIGFAGSVPDAARNQDKAALLTLLKQGADVNAPQPDGATALHWAARWDDLETADLLIHAGANVKAANHFGATPLSLACINGSAAMIGKLLKAGADPNAAVSDAGDTALMLAARTGKADALTLLLDHKAAPNQGNKRGQTPLMWAVAAKNVEAVRTLIERGADVNARTMLEPPATKAQLALSSPFPPGGMTALLYAAREGDLESARILIKAGADVKMAAGNGTSPLLVAIENARYAMAHLLLDSGADPNAADEYGRQALFAAVEMRNMEWSTRPFPPERDDAACLKLIQAILAHGAHPNARLTKKIPLRGQPSFDGRWANMVGATPFWRAAEADDVALMRLLVANGADPLLASSDNTTPLMVAAGVGWNDTSRGFNFKDQALDAVKLCLELGNDINAANRTGHTALHGAAYRGANDVVQFLVDKGADMAAKNGEGRMPVNMAEGMHIAPGGWVEHLDTAALLRKLMARPA